MDSPLTGITSIERLLSLPYLDFIACLGHYPIHPGGEFATRRLLEAIGPITGRRVLEVGSGTGWTTRLLLEANAEVYVAEKHPRMLMATLWNCDRFLGILPNRFFLTSAEALENIPDRSVDLVMYEAVLGFVKSKELAIEQAVKRLKGPGSQIASIGHHYVAQPPPGLRSTIGSSIGLDSRVMFANDWQQLFSAGGRFRQIFWEELDFPHESKARSPEQIKNSMALAGLSDDVGFLDDQAFNKMHNKFEQWESLFASNRKHMRFHIAAYALN